MGKKNHFFFNLWGKISWKFHPWHSFSRKMLNSWCFDNFFKRCPILGTLLIYSGGGCVIIRPTYPTRWFYSWMSCNISQIFCSKICVYDSCTVYNFSWKIGHENWLFHFGKNCVFGNNYGNKLLDVSFCPQNVVSMFHSKNLDTQVIKTFI